jgi:hypothetical protein
MGGGQLLLPVTSMRQQMAWVNTSNNHLSSSFTDVYLFLPSSRVVPRRASSSPWSVGTPKTRWFETGRCLFE